MYSYFEIPQGNFGNSPTGGATLDLSKTLNLKNLTQSVFAQAANVVNYQTPLSEILYNSLDNLWS